MRPTPFRFSPEEPAAGRSTESSENEGDNTLADDALPPAPSGPAPVDQADATSRMVPVLMVTNPRGGMDLAVITKRETLLGRDPSADIRILSPQASRRHALIAYENIGQPDRAPSCVLIDNDSHNGTLLNGTRINKPTPLKAGDTLVIGGRSILYICRTKREVESEQVLRDKIRRAPASIIEHRFPIDDPAKVSFLLPEETFNPYALAGRAMDLSLRGVRLSLPEFPQELYGQLLKGPRYAKVLITPEGEEPLPALHGRVAWVDHRWSSGSSETQLGIEFEHLPIECRQKLNDFLSARAYSG